MSYEEAVICPQSTEKRGEAAGGQSQYRLHVSRVLGHHLLGGQGFQEKMDKI